MAQHTPLFPSTNVSISCGSALGTERAHPLYFIPSFEVISSEHLHTGLGTWIQSPLREFCEKLYVLWWCDHYRVLHHLHSMLGGDHERMEACRACQTIGWIPLSTTDVMSRCTTLSDTESHWDTIEKCGRTSTFAFLSTIKSQWGIPFVHGSFIIVIRKILLEISLAKSLY